MAYDHTPFHKIQILNPKDQTQNPRFWFCRIWFFRSDRGRSTARVDRALCSALCLFGSTGAVDRSPPTVKKNDRWRSTGPVDRQLSEILTDSNSSIFWQIFVGISPQRISLAVLPSFSTSINSGSLQHDMTLIYKPIFTSILSSFYLRKDFQSQNFHTPIWSLLPLLHSRYLHYTIPNSTSTYWL